MRHKFTPNAVRIEDDVAYLALTNRQGETVAEAIIDTEDLGRVLAAGRWYPSWNKHMGSYYVLNNSLRTSLHRFVMHTPCGADVDHTNHNTLDCRKSELRICQHQQNMQNRHGPARNNRSGVRGVYWDTSARMWRVEVKANGRKHRIGRFHDLDDAAEAAQQARRRLHGEFAK